MKMGRPQSVDFHCHLDLYPDHVELIEESDRLKIATLTVTTTPKAYLKNVALAKNSEFVHVSLGLHPQLVGERASELPLLLELLPNAKYIGEVGLDAGPKFFKTLEVQEAVFSAILSACARAGGKILTVHSVRSAKKVLDFIEKLLPQDRARVVLHWFSGTNSEVRRAVELGCYFSVNEAMLIGAKSRTLISNMPLNRILTETDGPFLQVDGRQARPRDAARCRPMLETLFSISDVQNQINRNLKELLTIVGA